MWTVFVVVLSPGVDDAPRIALIDGPTVMSAFSNTWMPGTLNQPLADAQVQHAENPRLRQHLEEAA